MLIFPLEKTCLYKSQKEQSFESVNIKVCFNCFVNAEQSQPGNSFYCNYCKQEFSYELKNQLLNRGKHLVFDVNLTITYILDDLDDYLIPLNTNKNELGVRYELI